MAQVKCFGTEINFQKNKKIISDAIHKSLVEVFLLPQEKKFHLDALRIRPAMRE